MFQDRWYQTEAVESIGPFYTGEVEGNPLIGLPTGTGKSLVSARINQRIAEYFPWHRGINLTHVKELVDQNSKKLLQVWPTAPMGILSAGLGKRDTEHPIIFAGIGTAVNRVHELGHRDYCLIDEAHLVGDKETAMYSRFIAGLRETNPKLRVMGMSATLYRMKMGTLLDGGIFTHTAYDLTDVAGFNKLLGEGYIAPLIPQPTNTILDTDGVGKTAGEFSKGALEKAVDKNEITSACVDEMIERAWDRKCWMVFASGVKHAEHIAAELNARGITAAAVHSKKKGNDQILTDFKAGKIRCIVNYGKLTTGFDHPPIDFIGMMRPTMSPALWVQMLGRGTRPYDGRYANQYIPGFEYIKINCLVLDFARNADRLGPINDPVLPRKPGEKGGDAPIKICEAKNLKVNEGLDPKTNILENGCSTYNHASAKFCCLCEREFIVGGAKLFATAGTAVLIAGDPEPPLVEYWDVSHTLYSIVNKNGVPPMMRVKYVSGVRSVDEIICLEHTTRAKHFAHEWWKQRFGSVPTCTAEGLSIAHRGLLPMPKKVRVHVNCKPYAKVLSHEY